jgi:hypothetical protein
MGIPQGWSFQWPLEIRVDLFTEFMCFSSSLFTLDQFLLRKWGHVGPYHLQLQYCAFLFLVMPIVSRLLSRSHYGLVHFRPVDYCSSLVIVLASLLF